MRIGRIQLTPPRVSMIVITLTICMTCAFIIYASHKANQQLLMYEEKLKINYPNVAYINQNRFITVDTKGNVFIVELNGKTTLVLTLHEIETGLNREFTLADIQKPNDPAKRKHK